MMNLVNKFLLLSVLCFASCKSIKFNPDFYVGDSTSKSIVSERGDVIETSDARFDEFACLHKEKVKELKRLLMSKKIGPNNRANVSKKYAQLTKQFARE